MSAVSNPYIFNIKENYNSKAEINIAFTSQSWTSPGTYTWVAPFTGTVIVCVIGGGGGANNDSFEGNGKNQFKYAGSGGTSSFYNITATGGGGGGTTRYSNDDWFGQAKGGSAGSPNGRTGGATANNSNGSSVSGGQGFALATKLTNGSYGSGGNASDNSYMDTCAGGGSGGCNITTISVISGTSYKIVVGSGGTSIRASHGTSNNGNSGAIGIWKS